MSHGDQFFSSRSGGGGIWFRFSGPSRLADETLSDLVNFGCQSVGSFSDRFAHKTFRKLDKFGIFSGLLDSGYLRGVHHFFDFWLG